MTLSASVATRGRFSRSINVEHAHGRSAVDGYLPTGRALDVIRRVDRALNAPNGGRAFSITGPHGSGKSSLATFLSALLGPARASERAAAEAILAEADPELAASIAAAHERLGTTSKGFVRAVAVADREPVTATVARALALGAQHYFARSRRNPVPAAWADPVLGAKLTPREVRDALAALSGHAPVLLLIDEFGKNLEAYAESSRDGDPYLLQQVAEWADRGDGQPLIVATFQHLSFEEYVQESTTAQRREWVKIQGRFEDIAYVETASQSRRLIAAAFDRSVGPLDTAVTDWAASIRDGYRAAGLGHLVDDGLATRAYPLEPLVLAVLPDLCSRYGQNERTLFSFLAGAEPLAVPEFLHTTTWTPGMPVPTVGLDRVYDYFVASASNMIGASATGSRWLEIETRIRDTHGLTSTELSALKAIGVLNLVSSGGALRASRQVLELAVNTDVDDLTAALLHLETLGLVTYREFADEYRIWRGSDFDLKGNLELARRRAAERPLADLLNEAAPLTPVVAARHSQRCGTLRIFERRYSDLRAGDLEPPAAGSPWDGLVLYATSDTRPTYTAEPNAKPIVVVYPHDLDTVRSAAVEAAALVDALHSAEAADADWVARRELIERTASARQRLGELLAPAYDVAAATWVRLSSRSALDASAGVSSVLSAVADSAYRHAPPIMNEMLARRELTSQGAKARRLLVEAMLDHADTEQLGLNGFPPERAMYDAVLRVSQIHRQGASGFEFAAPADRRFVPVWQAILAEFERAKDQRVELTDIWRRLQAPPFGLKDGPIPVFVIAALLVHSDEVALYEHGSLLLGLTDAVAERLLRNPGHFSVKNTAAQAAVRRRFVEQLAERLGYTSSRGAPTFLFVARSLYRDLRSLEPYSLSTNKVTPTTQQLRQAFLTASEPDQLLFVELPRIFGRPTVPTGTGRGYDVELLVNLIGASIDELRHAYPAMLTKIRADLARELLEEPAAMRRRVASQAEALRGRVLDPRLKAFTAAVARDELDDREWLENLAMVVADAQAPRSWNDETVERFRLAAAEVAGSFRRLLALLFDRRAEGDDASEVRRITVTRPDGTEQAEVVWLTQREHDALDDVISEALDSAAGRVGSPERARQLLLALLADRAIADMVRGDTDGVTAVEERHG